MSQTKKNRIDLDNNNQIFKEELYNNKFTKTLLFIGFGLLGFFALGFVFKAVNYTAHNFKNLNETLKR